VRPNFDEKTLLVTPDMVLMVDFQLLLIYRNPEAGLKVHGFGSTKLKKAVPNPLMPLLDHKGMSNWSSIIEQQGIC
tara:strand:+ start:230 stop:457 length:228 start_codon:yes stop_codon:yes gene_type:complete